MIGSRRLIPALSFLMFACVGCAAAGAPQSAQEGPGGSDRGATREENATPGEERTEKAVPPRTVSLGGAHVPAGYGEGFC